MKKLMLVSLMVVSFFQIQAQSLDATTTPIDVAQFEAATIDLNYFRVRASMTTITLEWETATADLHKGFTVERSTDQKNWQKVTFVATNGTQQFNCPDQDVMPAVIYYRLVQKADFGPNATSKVVSVDMNEFLGEPETLDFELSGLAQH